MTPPDPTLPPDDGPVDDDTLAVNAVVDDEATAEQRRRVARDPELVARVASLRAAVAAVAAPVDPPGADVLAEIRRRALDALDEPEAATDDADDVETPPVVPSPVRDLGAARARRTRSLPPLPAVAAVVILLVLVGVGFIVAGSGGKDDRGETTAAEMSGGGSGGDDAGGAPEESAENDAAAADGSTGETTSAPSERPSDEAYGALLDRTTAQYDSEAALLADLRTIDPGGLTLAGSATDVAPSTTTVPVPGQTDGDDGSAAALADDPVAQRCDDTVRAAESDLEPATAAVLVDVDGEPVLVLSNPVEVSEDAPSGVRFTVLNALDCSPRAAVLR